MKAWNSILILLAFILTCSVALPQDDKFSGTDLDQYFKDKIEHNNMICLGACLIKDGRIIWENAYGYSDFENKVPVKVDDIFQIASLSKTITATAFMQIVEKGLIGLDDNINNYLPFKVINPNFPEKTITPRMLLTHTAGFDDLLPMGNKISLGVLGDSPIPLAEFVKELFTPEGKYYSADYFGKIEPGTKYSYSNIAFSLLGYLVENIMNQDFDEYCKKNIFIPLEMYNTGWHLKGMDTTRMVFGYGVRNFQDTVAAYRKQRHFGTPGYPEGMLRTTMQDFSHFISAYLNNGRYKDFQLLKPETLEIMLTPQGIKNIPSRSLPIYDISLTWVIFDLDGKHYYSMNGFSGSMFTNAFFSLEDKTGVMYYYTGISLKNMQSTNDISKKLLSTVSQN